MVLMKKKVSYGTVEDAGIKVNSKMGISEKEHNEIRETEMMTIVVTDSGQVGLYYSDGTPALNGVSAGGFLRRDDPRTIKLKGLI